MSAAAAELGGACRPGLRAGGLRRRRLEPAEVLGDPVGGHGQDQQADQHNHAAEADHQASRNGRASSQPARYGGRHRPAPGRTAPR